MLGNKLGLVMGVANHRSLAWAIATAAARNGAELILTYQDERQGDEVRALAADWPAVRLVLPCDVADDDAVAAMGKRLAGEFGGLDFAVHSIAFARREDLAGGVLATGREGWRTALETSAYSFNAMARAVAPLLEARGGGSLLTLTYLGGERVVTGYGIMGIAKATLQHSVRYLAAELGPRNIRVNAISAGPVRTVAARGIPDFSEMHRRHAELAPLRRNVDADEIAESALYLLGPSSRGVTGETLHVDAGFHLLAP